MSARVDAALSEVRAELLSAMEKFPPINSTHEGYAVIAEELDELWADVKANGTVAAIHEARQVAAMAVRFMLDCAPAAAPANQTETT